MGIRLTGADKQNCNVIGQCTWLVLEHNNINLGNERYKVYTDVAPASEINYKLNFNFQIVLFNLYRMQLKTNCYAIPSYKQIL